MNKKKSEEFLQPEFEGQRFLDHRLPVDVAADLATYQTLVLELSKHLYLKAHPKRQKVPRGFARGVELHLEKIEEGSAKPLLALVFAAHMATAQINQSKPYLEQAREVIAQCISPSGDKLPEDFPKELLHHFSSLGRSLREGERMNLAFSGGKKATLTPERRERLVAAAHEVFKETTSFSGTLVGVHFEKRYLVVKTDAGKQIQVPMPDDFDEHARQSGGRQRDRVTVSGLGEYDSWKRLLRIAEGATVTVDQGYELGKAFHTISELKDGWYDGKGVAPSNGKLDYFRDRMIEFYPDDLPLPIIFPTPEGNIVLEWDGLPADPSVDVNLKTLVAYFHAFGKDVPDVESEFPLDSDEDWIHFTKLLGTQIPTISER